LSLAGRHGIDPLWVTCNPDNFASRRSCERLGAQLVEIVPVPLKHPLYQRGEMEKCRYRVQTAPKAQV
jgi:tagatose 1,6-diphosphate aldolase